jgi:hypothetical protein
MALPFYASGHCHFMVQGTDGVRDGTKNERAPRIGLPLEGELSRSIRPHGEFGSSCARMIAIKHECADAGDADSRHDHFPVGAALLDRSKETGYRNLNCRLELIAAAGPTVTAEAHVMTPPRASHFNFEPEDLGVVGAGICARAAVGRARINASAMGLMSFDSFALLIIRTSRRKSLSNTCCGKRVYSQVRTRIVKPFCELSLENVPELSYPRIDNTAYETTFACVARASLAPTAAVAARQH